MGTPACTAGRPAVHAMEEVLGLFPTPFTRVHGALDKAPVDGLVAHFTAQAVNGNTSSLKRKN